MAASNRNKDLVQSIIKHAEWQSKKGQTEHFQEIQSKNLFFFLTDFFIFFSLYLIVAFKITVEFKSLDLHNNSTCKPATLAAMAKGANFLISSPSMSNL